MGCLALWQLLDASAQSDASRLAGSRLMGDQSTFTQHKDGFLHSVGSWASWHLWRRGMGEVHWTCFPSTACGLPEGSEGIEGFASVGHQKFGLIFVRYGYRGHRLAFFFFPSYSSRRRRGTVLIGAILHGLLCLPGEYPIPRYPLTSQQFDTQSALYE